MIDIDKVFELFSNEKIISTEYNDSPEYSLNLFKKVLSNRIIIRKKLIQLFQETTLSEADILASVNNVIYNRAWAYISKLKIDNHYIKFIKSCNNHDLICYIVLSINYFETQEDYEKCAFLLNLKNLFS